MSTSAVKYIGMCGGLFSKAMNTEAEAIDWVSKQLDTKASTTEGYVLETVTRVRKASPPLLVEPVIPQPKFPQMDPEKPGHDYSNEKNDRAVGSTHTGEIGAGYDFGHRNSVSHGLPEEPNKF